MTSVRQELQIHYDWAMHPTRRTPPKLSQEAADVIEAHLEGKGLPGRNPMAYLMAEFLLTPALLAKFLGEVISSL